MLQLIAIFIINIKQLISTCYQILSHLIVYLLNYITIVALVSIGLALWNVSQYTYHHIPMVCMGSVCKNTSAFWLTLLKTHSTTTFQKPRAACCEKNQYKTWLKSKYWNVCWLGVSNFRMWWNKLILYGPKYWNVMKCWNPATIKSWIPSLKLTFSPLFKMEEVGILSRFLLGRVCPAYFQGQTYWRASFQGPVYQLPTFRFTHPFHRHLSWALPWHRLRPVRCAHPMPRWLHPSNTPTCDSSANVFWRSYRFINGWDAGSPKRWDRWHSPFPNWQYIPLIYCLLGGYMLPTTF